jgi:hypothetical protein
MVAPYLSYEEFENVARVVETFSAATDLSGSLFEGRWDGSARTPQERRVEADKLAEEIAAQAQTTAFAYTRMGDMIVSDPTKLAELGKWARCDPDGGCGPDGRYAEYALTANAQTVNGAVATRAVERELYRQLVPLAFPVWNTGMTRELPSETDDWHDSVLNPFKCTPNANNPFLGSPASAHFAFLQQIDPANPGVYGRVGHWELTRNVSQVSLMVARSHSVYSWPSETILNRMFDPIDPSDPADGAGLGLSPAEVMLNPTSVYEPPSDIGCSW